jgi:Fe-S-cluster containining protein
MSANQFLSDATKPSSGSGAAPARLSFPFDGARFPWLPMLLDAYHMTDQGVAEGVRREQAQGRRLACARGCAACCRSHTTVPVYPLELIGMTWYATEQVQGPARERLKQQLRDHSTRPGCPFLIDEACAIHPMRPMACRQFNVFDRVCAEGEDAYYTRRADVLTPIKRFSDDAFYMMMPFYGVQKNSERRRAVKEGRLHVLARVLRELNWASVADKMDEFDRSRPGA